MSNPKPKAAVPPSNLPIVDLPIGDVVPNPRNPRNHPEDQLDRLRQSLKKFGQPKPILARKANHMIIAGHGVHAAAQRAELPTIRVMLWDVDQATADAYMLADNQHGVGARDDQDRTKEILREAGISDFEALGFATEEAEKLLAVSEETLEVHTIDTEPVNDRFWISVRGDLRNQAEALVHLRELMKRFPDVEVELGTLEQ